MKFVRHSPGVRPAADKLACCIVSRKTSRGLNGALLRGLFLGAHAKCTTPSVDVQSVPRFTRLDHHGRQVYQKKTHQRLLLWEVSVMQQRRPAPETTLERKRFAMKNSANN